MVSNRNFSIPIHILKELEKCIIDFVWAGKKHEVDKNILYANLEHGVLKLTNIPNRVSSQRIVWLSKLSTMEKNCFTRVFRIQSLFCQDYSIEQKFFNTYPYSQRTRKMHYRFRMGWKETRS